MVNVTLHDRDHAVVGYDDTLNREEAPSDVVKIQTQ